jgi:hypothetical protein
MILTRKSRNPKRGGSLHVLTTTGRRWDDDEWRKMGEYAEGLQV